MKLPGIADAEQLTALTKLLDEYAKEVGIEGDMVAARDRLAARIMSLFNDGITMPADIRRELDASRSHWLNESLPSSLRLGAFGL